MVTSYYKRERESELEKLWGFTTQYLKLKTIEIIRNGVFEYETLGFPAICKKLLQSKAFARPHPYSVLIGGSQTRGWLWIKTLSISCRGSGSDRGSNISQQQPDQPRQTDRYTPGQRTTHHPPSQPTSHPQTAAKT